MAINLYTPDGWADMRSIIFETTTPYVAIIGGTGIGKTYGALKLFCEDRIPFVYMRRTKTQLDTASVGRLCPFNPLNNDLGTNIELKAIAKTDCYNIVDGEQELGLAVSMSTLGNQRGIDGTSFDYLYLDEFIRQKQEKRTKFEDEAFMSAYDLLNRNRELGKNPKPPLKAILTGNTHVPDSPILEILGGGNAVDYFKRHPNKDVYVNRQLTVVNLRDSPIATERLKKSVVAQIEDSAYKDMALFNEYDSSVYEHVIDKGVPLREYKAICKFDTLCIYAHKTQNKYYVSEFTSGAPIVYANVDTERTRFIRRYAAIYFAYQNGNVLFNTYRCKRKFLNIFN